MSKQILKNGYRIQANAQNQKAKQVFLYGVIGWDIDVQMLLNEIANLPDSVEELDFYVHSEGGLVYEGYALLTNLERLKDQYYTRMHIDGIAASMMSAVAVAAHETIASPTSKMIVHDPWLSLDIYGGYNSARIEMLIQELESIKDDLDSDGDIMAGVYARKTGLTVAEVRAKWMSDGQDHHFTPAQMLEAGLVDSIAQGEFPKPEKAEEIDEDTWLAELLMKGRKAAMTGSKGHKPIYRGEHEKLLGRFAFNSDNDDNYSSSPNNNQNQPKKTMSRFAAIARKYGLDENIGETGLLAHIEKREKKISDLEAKVNSQQGLIDNFEAKKDSMEATIKGLKAENRKTKAAKVVDDVIAGVEKEHNGKTVNANISDQLSDLAVTHLQAQEEEDEKTAKNAKQHMELLAENNLIPIGSDPDLDDDKTARSQEDGPGGLSEDALAKAKKEGEQRRAKTNGIPKN